MWIVIWQSCETIWLLNFDRLLQHFDGWVNACANSWSTMYVCTHQLPQALKVENTSYQISYTVVTHVYTQTQLHMYCTYIHTYKHTHTVLHTDTNGQQLTGTCQFLSCYMFAQEWIAPPYLLHNNEALWHHKCTCNVHTHKHTHTVLSHTINLKTTSSITPHLPKHVIGWQ